MAEPEVLDLTFDSASDDEDRAPPVRAPGYKNHNAPGLREAPEAPRRRSVPTKRYSEEFAPPREAVKDDDERRVDEGMDKSHVECYLLPYEST